MIRLTIMLFLLCFSVSAQSLPNLDKKVLERLDKLSNEINTTLLPKMVDKHTRFDSTYVLDNFFVGRHTISDQVIAVGKEKITKYLKEITINQYCTSMTAEHKYFRKHGVGMKRTYYSEKGVFITEATATIKDCN